MINGSTDLKSMPNPCLTQQPLDPYIEDFPTPGGDSDGFWHLPGEPIAGFFGGHGATSGHPRAGDGHWRAEVAEVAAVAVPPAEAAAMEARRSISKANIKSENKQKVRVGFRKIIHKMRDPVVKTRFPLISFPLFLFRSLLPLSNVRI